MSSLSRFLVLSFVLSLENVHAVKLLFMTMDGLPTDGFIVAVGYYLTCLFGFFCFVFLE